MPINREEADGVTDVQMPHLYSSIHHLPHLLFPAKPLTAQIFDKHLFHTII